MPKEFKGLLNEYLPPFDRHRMGIVAALRKDWTEYHELSSLRTRQEAERLCLLFQHYDISPDSPGAAVALALALARDFVPGFKECPVKPVRGAKTKWTFAVLIKLHTEAQNLLATTGATQKEVFAHLAKTAHWKKFLRSNDGHKDPDPAHALAKQYRRAESELKELHQQYKASIEKAAKKKPAKKTLFSF